jgi:hypothetical protein
MPELPEVQTIVDDLKRKITRHKILAVCTDWEKLIKEPCFRKFQEEISGLIIQDIQRRAKNIIINLSVHKTLLIHLKMTGHLLVSSCWEFKRGKLRKIKNTQCPEDDSITSDKMNQFVHIGFELDKKYVTIANNKLKYEQPNSKLGEYWVSFFLKDIVSLRDIDWEGLSKYYLLPQNNREIDHTKIEFIDKKKILKHFDFVINGNVKIKQDSMQFEFCNCQ